MKITAQERGRRLHITVGGREEGMTEAEAAQADADAVHVAVPPVSAAVGLQIWALYSGIMFNELEDTAEQDATRLVAMALGTYSDPAGTDEEHAAAAAQEALLEGLRWEEGNLIGELAIYWNTRGGGMDVVNARIQDGNPKAQDILTKRNGLWGVLSQLRRLRSGEWESLTPEQGATPDTNTPAGT